RSSHTAVRSATRSVRRSACCPELAAGRFPLGSRWRYDRRTGGSTPTRSRYTSPAVPGGARRRLGPIPVGPEREATHTVVVANREHLVNLRAGRFEVHGGSGHVEPPYPRPARAGLRDGLRP